MRKTYEPGEAIFVFDRLQPCIEKLTEYMVNLPGHLPCKVSTSTSTLFNNKNIDYDRLARKIAIANLGGSIKRRIK